MARNLIDRKLAFLSIAFGCSLLTIIATLSNSFSTLENRIWDWRAKFISRHHSADPKVKLIVIDQASLDYYAREEGITWPWPRQLYIPVVKFLENAGARGLAFDLLLTESSVSGVEDDKELATSFSTKLPIVSAIALYQGPNNDTAAKKQVQPFANSPSVPANWPDLYLGQHVPIDPSAATYPVPELIEKSAALGVVNAEHDPDGIFRHYRLGTHLVGGTNPLPSLPLALFLATNHSAPADLTGFLNDRGQLTVRFRGQGATYQPQNIANIIASYVSLEEGKPPLVDPTQYKDALVFLGVWAPGLFDLRPTSIDPSFRGVEFNATVLDNLIHQDFIREAHPSWNIAFAIFFIVILSATTLFIRMTSFQVIAGSAVVALFVTVGMALALNGIWIAMAVPGIGLTLAIFLSIFYQYYHEGRQHRFIKSAFAHYVSPDVIEQIVRDPSNLSLGGDRKELTIFFSDLAGFTTLSEKLDPSVLLRLLNSYLTAMTDIILASGGTLDKYEGDAIIAFWNAPLAFEDHADRAVDAAIKCHQKLVAMNPELESEFGARLAMRIGLHSGQVSVGNFGSRERFNYTIIGDAANLASRLEGANKVFGTQMLVSQSTCELLTCTVAMRQIGAVRVVGRERSVTVFEPAALSGLAESDLKLFEQGLAHFEAGRLTQAQEYFSRLVNDSVAQSYLNRIQTEKGQHSDSWSPIWNLSQK